MIIPSIDLQGGQTVQLVGGATLELEAGDPRPLLRRFSQVGEVAVVDLDAALGRGDNRALVTALIRQAPCRVGGGIRDVASARAWLDAGATQVVLGTAAVPEVLRELPRARVIAALDARHGEVVVEGWQRGTGRGVAERMHELRDLVGGFLVTSVEREGRLAGVDLAQVKELRAAAGAARLTIAGGVRSAEEVAALDALGADAQVGMALYKGLLDLGDCVAAVLRSDRPDGLFPTVVCDEQGVALGLCYSSRESLREALRSQTGVYQSRKRGLWRKGETSGATQELLRVAVDCDRDALRFTVRQRPPGFCHEERWTCFGDAQGLTALQQTLAQRARGDEGAVAGSYTQRLLRDPDLLRAKLLEEAGELADAQGAEAVAWEAADLLYFALVAMSRSGVSLAEVEAHLELRSRKLSRRPGDKKPGGPS